MSAPPVDLAGLWQVAPADDALRRAYLDYDFDDTAWETLDVPGHWQRHASLAGSDGPVLHRRRFELDRPEDDVRGWLVLDGVMYQSDVWLDGLYLGDTEGYFFPHQFEVTEHLGRRREHCLATEVACHPQRDTGRKRNLTGVFQHWDVIDPSHNPGGIWGDVRVEWSGPVRILHHRVICRDADLTRATLAIRTVLHSIDERDVVVRTRVASTEHVVERRLAAGENQLEWTVVIPDPSLWWPHALGQQPMHDVVVEVTDPDGRTSDRRVRRVGLRSIAMRDWVTSINGERLFLKGTNLGPTSPWLAETTGEDHRRVLALAKDAGLDLVRVHAHVSRPELYDLADEMGMLVWQDLPLQWAYHRSVRRPAVRQAREAVDLLGHHPSIMVWCGHNSPLAVGPRPVVSDSGRRRGLDYLLAQQLPTYNRTVLDRSIASALRHADRSRPVVPHSGMLPSLPRLDGTDSHLYLGWYVGDERQLPDLCAAMPRLVRFVSEFGAQSVGAQVAPRPGAIWPDLGEPADTPADRAHLIDPLTRRIPPEAYESFAEWAAATRAYQAQVIRHAVETLRRLKYRPTGGFAQYLLADAADGVDQLASWAIISADGDATEAYRALAEACRPVIVVADRLPAHLHDGDALALDVHVVSDLRVPIRTASVTSTIAWDGGEMTTGWRGSIDADRCARVGTVQLVVPERPGTLRLDLELRYDDVVITRRDETTIVTGPHVH